MGGHSLFFFFLLRFNLHTVNSDFLCDQFYEFLQTYMV